MKKIALLFLSLLFIVALPMCCLADADVYEGIKGQTVTTVKKSGELAGGCDGKKEGESCVSPGASVAKCLSLESRGKKQLSCTVLECKTGYILHRGYGICRTEKYAQDFCKNPKNLTEECKTGEMARPFVQANTNIDSKTKKKYGGKEFRKCFCDDKNKITYSCGDGQGTPPTNSGNFTNLDTITIAENTCSKSAAVFTGWNCDGKTKQAGDTISIENKATCTAQWKNCDACNPGKGCGCSVSVKDNKCVYTTSIDKGYVLVSGKNGVNPQCVLVGEKECKDAGGDWKNGSCKCKPDVAGTHFDIKNKQCVCDDATKVLENGKCVVPTKCPDDASGKYPNCTCSGGKEYKKDTNKCECPDGQTEIDGQCKEPTVEPEKAPVVEEPPVVEEEPIVEEEPVVEEEPQPEEEPTVDENPDEKNCKKAKDTKWTGTECVCKDSNLTFENGVCKRSDEERKKALEDKKKAYDEAKDNEQSLANRTLTAATVAATGIGGMELAMGLSQQKADKEADQNMAAYIATMRCTYGDGKQVKAGLEEIELPGGNDEELMNLRTEYFALAADLKVRKEALGMKPGIESEEILDKSKMGLYDDEYKGIETGAYESLYRATMLGSEADQAKIAEERDTSKKRVIGGAVALGGGIVLSAVGNSLINGKLGEKIKERKKDKKKLNEMTDEEFDVFVSEQELSTEKTDNLRKCLAENKDDTNLSFEDLVKKCE